MTIPTYQELMRPVLAHLASGETIAFRALVEAIAREASLTPEEIAFTTASGGRQFDGKVGWATTYLAGGGAVVRPSRGQVRITDLGRRILSEHESVDNRVLRTYPEFHEWYERIRAGRPNQPGSSVTDTEAGPASESSPQERIADAEAEYRVALESELHVKAHSIDPTQFEKLVLRLLQKMGYGEAGALEHSGGPGDGGFDGIISQDPLGLDRIYLQAKRYGPDNSVQRPEIQKFVGALAGARGDRGVFITTSRFSSSARLEVEKGAARIELIDGDRLAELMVKYGVGVQVESEIKLYRMDDDFFEAL